MKKAGTHARRKRNVSSAFRDLFGFSPTRIDGGFIIRYVNSTAPSRELRPRGRGGGRASGDEEVFNIREIARETSARDEEADAEDAAAVTYSPMPTN